MLNIDSYAYQSKLKTIAAHEKLFFTLLTLFSCFWLNSTPASIIILFVMSWLTVYKGGTPFSFFVKLMLIPISFLLLSLLTIVFTIQSTSNGLMFSLPLFHMYVGVTSHGLLTTAALFFKAFAAVSCLYFISLSTPMVELISALRRLKCPSLLTELMALIYRFIFVLMDTAQTIYIAQNARLGYASTTLGFRSLAALISSLFIRTYKRSDLLYTALESRGYEDELLVLEEPTPKNYHHYLYALGFNGLLIFFVILLGL